LAERLALGIHQETGPKTAGTPGKEPVPSPDSDKLDKVTVALERIADAVQAQRGAQDRVPNSARDPWVAADLVRLQRDVDAIRTDLSEVKRLSQNGAGRMDSDPAIKAVANQLEAITVLTQSLQASSSRLLEQVARAEAETAQIRDLMAAKLPGILDSLARLEHREDVAGTVKDVMELTTRNYRILQRVDDDAERSTREASLAAVKRDTERIGMELQELKAESRSVGSDGVVLEQRLADIRAEVDEFSRRFLIIESAIDRIDVAVKEQMAGLKASVADVNEAVARHSERSAEASATQTEALRASLADVREAVARHSELAAEASASQTEVLRASVADVKEAVARHSERTTTEVADVRAILNELSYGLPIVQSAVDRIERSVEASTGDRSLGGSVSEVRRALDSLSARVDAIRSAVFLLESRPDVATVVADTRELTIAGKVALAGIDRNQERASSALNDMRHLLTELRKQTEDLQRAQLDTARERSVSDLKKGLEETKSVSEGSAKLMVALNQRIPDGWADQVGSGVRQLFERAERLAGRDLADHTFRFDENSVQISPSELDSLREKLRGKDVASLRILIIGLATTNGSPERNLLLSQRRAEAVRAWVITALGVPPARVFAVGGGTGHERSARVYWSVDGQEQPASPMPATRAVQG
jgi:outer membrane protein OmpA-like peptidoglycan-associated protein